MLLRMDEIENDPSSPAEGEGPDSSREQEGEEGETASGADNADEGEELYEDDAFEHQEFSALNRQLDQLQSALDDMESRNDNIHKVLLEILQSNREVRKDLSEANKKSGEGGGASGSEEEGSAGGLAGQALVVAALELKALELGDETKAMAGLMKSVTDKIDKL